MLVYKKNILASIVLMLLFSFSRINAQTDYQLFLKGSKITDIKQDGTSIWFSTYGDGIYQYSAKDDKWINYSSANSNLDNDLFNCVAANKDYIWAGSSEGLFICSRKTGKWTKRKFAQGGEFGNWIRSLTYDEKKGRLWVGRFRNVTVFDIKKNSFTDYNRAQSGDDKTNNINTIALEGDSAVWFGAEYGMHRFEARKNIDNSENWTYYNNKDRNFNGEGNSVSVTDFVFFKKEIWLGTDEFITKEQPEYNIGGIYVWDRKLKWDRISKANGLGGNGIYCLAQTGNYIWAAVYEFKKNDKEEYGKGLFLINRLTKKVSAIDLNELDLNTSNIHALHFDGTYMWIGTTEGVIRLKIANELAQIRK